MHFKILIIHSDFILMLGPNTINLTISLFVSRKNTKCFKQLFYDLN